MKWYRLCLLKAYFDKGYGVTSYFKYLIGFYALASLNVKSTLILGIVYGFLCFLIGYLWYKWRIADAELEVQNQFNPFVREMREEFNGNR